MFLVSYTTMKSIEVIRDNLYYVPEFLDTREANHLFSALLTELSWSNETIQIFGKSISVPRLVCWYGDRDAYYRYSAVDHIPLAWTTPLRTLKKKLQLFTGSKFNSVLGNLYRNGQDSMGWHADDEKELGNQPTIASVSLGYSRMFKIRRKDRSKSCNITLENGSLLIMTGNFQQMWQHSVPKTRAPVEARINLTFRYILASARTVRLGK